MFGLDRKGKGDGQRERLSIAGEGLGEGTTMHPLLRGFQSGC